ncbi:type II toxin-antitoxin system HicA family toxin [Fibrella aquatilis]|uniref:type II toxin-antitoxin system HicA family toxin n=1 Tax=Fibrella aquatilis TaxID=2817059 RepID=UPI00286DA57C|nr:type II toxin-antitoxin system HicA family toxin [Fibrella aquatilis]
MLKRIKGSHHIYFNPDLNETMPVPVHGNKDIGKGLLLKIIKKIGISITEMNG